MTMYRNRKEEKITVYGDFCKSKSKENLVKIYHTPKMSGPLPGLQRVGFGKGSQEVSIFGEKEKKKKNV